MLARIRPSGELVQSASTIREHPAVASSAPGNEPVIPGVTNPRVASMCLGVVHAVAAETVGLVDEHLKAAVAAQQNPYCEVVDIGGTQVRYATRVALLREGNLAERLNRAFEGSGDTAPPASALVQPTLDAIARRLSGFGYELCGKNTGAGSDVLEIAVRDPVYVTRVIEDRARQLKLLGDVSKLQQGMGVTAVNRPEQLLALRALVDDLCMTSVVTMTDCFELFMRSGTSLFSRGYFNLSGAVVPGRWVSGGDWGGHDVRKAGVVKLHAVDDVMARMRSLAVDGLAVNEDAFMSHVDKAIAERFAQFPALHVVVVGRYAETVNGATVVNYVAVCAEKPRRTVRAYVRDLLGASRNLALPAPANKALAAPAVIPPITEGPYATTLVSRPD